MDAFKKGDDIQGHRVLSELGRGAASVIYLAQNEKTKQIVAIKHVVKNTDKDQRFLDQAEAEYQVATKLDHPGFRKIHKILKKKEKLVKVRELYLLMELVDGTSLDVRPPKTFEEAVDIFAQTAEALAHMHAKGFVHADMKPNNVVVSDDGVAKVIDLGQSCPIGTVKKRIQGTPDYIAPEQVHMREITPRTDIYNLGAMMYWVLTRQHVPTALGREDSLMGRIDDALLERPKPAMEINSRIPRRLSDLIMDCVEIEPEARPDEMGFVAGKLRLIHGMLTSAQQQRSSTRTGSAAGDPEDSGEAPATDDSATVA